MPAVDPDRFKVAGLGQASPTPAPMKVTEMTDRVRESERVEFRPANGDGFLVRGTCRIVTIQVLFDLGERPECLHQVAGRAVLTQEFDRLKHEAMRILRPIRLPCELGLPTDLNRGICHPPTVLVQRLPGARPARAITGEIRYVGEGK